MLTPSGARRTATATGLRAFEVPSGSISVGYVNTFCQFRQWRPHFFAPRISPLTFSPPRPRNGRNDALSPKKHKATAFREWTKPTPGAKKNANADETTVERTKPPPSAYGGDTRVLAFRRWCGFVSLRVLVAFGVGFVHSLVALVLCVLGIWGILPGRGVGGVAARDISDI